MRCLIGLDDTDSKMGHCTTHLAYEMVGALLSQECKFDRYPRLVRLNPNIPFKTRGNAAVCLDFESDRPEEAFVTAESLLREFSDLENGANSGALFVEGGVHETELFRELYKRAVSGVVNFKRVAKLLELNGIRHVALGNGMGLVGAAASLGFRESDDHTFEVIAYRRPANFGRPRVVDPKSVKDAEAVLFPHVFNNYDYRARRVLVTPHGPDPVFLGIRSDSPSVALTALSMVRYEEELAGHMVYLSNQCTDAHLTSRLTVPLVAYSSGWLTGSVASLKREMGGHLYILLRSGRGRVGCIIYEPSADLVSMAARLAAGDRVRVYGGVRRGTRLHPPVLNVEKLEVLEVVQKLEFRNPRCTDCGGSTKSEGKGKGFQCRVCGSKLRIAPRVMTSIPRDLSPGVYLPSPGAQRHLTKQLIRYGAEVYDTPPVVEGWIRPDGRVRPLRVPARSPR